jgi:autotransporter translocation and assembly factor TamB
MGASISWQKLFVRMDTISVFNLRGKTSVRIRPQKDNPKKAEIKIKFNTDTLAERAGKIRARIEHAELNLNLQHVRDTVWRPEGNIEVNRVTLNLPQYGLPLTLRTLNANMYKDTLRLEKASLRMGRSNITLSGRVDRLMRTLQRGRKLRAQIDIKSRRIDCNQLLNALSTPSDTTLLSGDASNDISSFTDATSQTDIADSLLPADTLHGMTIFKVPRKLNLSVTMDVKKVFYDKLIFENIKGAIEVKNQTINLKSLLLRTMDADMHVSMVYAAPTTHLANVGFDLGIRDIKIENLTKFIPSLDSAMPMLRSFQGTVDVDVTASGALDSVMSIILPSLTAALHLHGENLVLLDGETFAQIAKMLLFKNKKHNMIDSLSTSITIQDGLINVFPFTVEMDRYRVAVGGYQDLDMNLNYHISVLKSPVPFTLGVNIKGTLDNLKYGLGKALYKHADSPAEIKRIDTTRLNLGKQIIEQFEGWIESQKGLIRTSRGGFGPRGRRAAVIDTSGAFEYVYDTVSGIFINPNTGEKFNPAASAATDTIK